MYIRDAVKLTGLTKKAIRYYMEQGLLPPAERSGRPEGPLYREFTCEDMERLQLIRELRELDFQVQEIKLILEDDPGKTARLLANRLDRLEKDLSAMNRIRELLQPLAAAHVEALTVEQLSAWLASSPPSPPAPPSASPQQIIRRLEQLFPGVLGRMLACHFGAFLEEETETEAQRQAWRELLDYLDDMEKPFALPQEAEQWYVSLSDQVLLDIMAHNRSQALQLAGASDRELLELAERTRQAAKDHHSLLQTVSPMIRRSKEMLSDQGYYEHIPRLMEQYSPLYARYMDRLRRLQELAGDAAYPDGGAPPQE